MKRSGGIVAIVLVLAVVGAFAYFYKHAGAGRNDGGSPSRSVTVRFGMLPYGDHTYAIIGERQGWFTEAGIKLDYRPIKIEDAVPFLRNGSLDVVSCPPGVIVAAYESGAQIVSFAFGDIFEGYAIMAQPNAGYRSVAELMKEGLSRRDAIARVASQMKGKTFSYPAEAAIKPFIDLVLKSGGLSRDTIKPLVLDDPLTVNAMRGRQADFQVGGVPSRLILQREGFKALLSSGDLAAAATPSPDSNELSSVFTDGWACTREYFEKNTDLILRMASINYRITQFINDHMKEALAIHMPYLSQVTGQAFSTTEGEIIYTSLDPFFTFDAQRDWYHNPQSPFYYLNLNGAIIKSFIAQGIFKKTPPSVEDIIFADDVYRRLEELKIVADRQIKEADGRQDLQASEAAKAQIAKARALYQSFNFLDAVNASSSASLDAARNH